MGTYILLCRAIYSVLMSKYSLTFKGISFNVGLVSIEFNMSVLLFVELTSGSNILSTRSLKFLIRVKSPIDFSRSKVSCIILFMFASLHPSRVPIWCFVPS
jgi:hypothetical protein